MKPTSLFNQIIFCVFLFIMISIVLISTAHAQKITENQPLRFGKIVLIDNNAPRQIELFPSGTYSADPEFIFFTDPQLGNITVDGYTPGTNLTVTVGVTNLTKGGSAIFTTSNSFTNPASVVADGTGSATFDVGATLTSDGNGGSFSDGSYTGNYSVTVTPTGP